MQPDVMEKKTKGVKAMKCCIFQRSVCDRV